MKQLEDFIIQHHGNIKIATRAYHRHSKKKAKAIKRKLKNPTRHYYLYLLKLEDSCYYIGMTSYKDAKQRYEQHKAGEGRVLKLSFNLLASS